MRIAIDMDGVLYELERTWRYMMREYRGVQAPPVEEWTTWAKLSSIGTSADRDWMWTEGVELGLFRYGHMIRDARRGMQALSDAGHELVIVTHRPKQAEADTNAWLDLYTKDLNVVGRFLLVNGEPKSCISADVLIDDKRENVLEWQSHGKDSLLFDQPWNREVSATEAVRVVGWKGTVQWLNALATQ